MVPAFPYLEQKNVRGGLPSDPEYTKLKDARRKEGIWLRDDVGIGCHIGMASGIATQDARVDR